MESGSVKFGKWNDWVQASRPPFYIATFIPLTMGFMLERNEGILAVQYIAVFRMIGHFLNGKNPRLQ